MIPSPLAPYAALIRFGLVMAVVAVIFAGGWKAGSGHATQQLQRAQAEQASKYLDAVTRAREAERASYAHSQQVSHDLQTDLAAIRAERDRLRDRPVPVVRLCPEPDPAGPGVPATGATPGGRDAAGPGTAQAAGEAGRDIGRPLYDLADDGDTREAELARRLSACQAYAATVAGTP